MDTHEASKPTAQTHGSDQLDPGGWPSSPAGRGIRIAAARWRHHPGVRSHERLTLGERAADRMRNGMGSWGFVFCALLFLAAWMTFNGRHGFDPYPFILLNLLLSCLAAMQGAILLIAARRSDQISSELALHDYETNRRSAAVLDRVHEQLTELRAEQARLTAAVADLGAPPSAGK